MSLQRPISSLFFVLILLCFTAHAARAIDLQFSWYPNSESDVIGYKIYYGLHSKSYSDIVEIIPSSANQQNGRIYGTVPGLDESKTYYFAITAYSYQKESTHSPEVIYHGSPQDDPPQDDPPQDDPPQDDPPQDDPPQDDPPLDGGLPLERGEVSVKHEWVPVYFQTQFINPIVVATMVSNNDSDPAVVRITNVNSAGFEIKIQEPEVLDGIHGLEKVSYMVMEQGRYTLADGNLIEAGEFNATRLDSFSYQSFNRRFNTTPVVMASISSDNGWKALTGRIKNITTTGFNYMMQDQESMSDNSANETISYIAWEPSAGTVNGITYRVARTGVTVKNNFTTTHYNTTFVQAPVVIANMNTTNGWDPAVLRCQNKNVTAIQFKIQEDQSKDSETGHTNEAVGYIILSSDTTQPPQDDPPQDDPPQGITLPLEAGEVQLNHTWSRVNFSSTYDQPVVVAKIMSYNESDPAIIRIKDVNRTGFSIRIQDWNNGGHTRETVSFLVMEQGKYVLPDGTRIEAETFRTSATGSFVQQTFKQRCSVPPVVMTSISSYNDDTPVTGRMRNISTSSFQYMMQEREASSGRHSTETISYITWEPSNNIIDGIRYSVGNTGRQVKETFFRNNYNTQNHYTFQRAPIVVVDMQTTYGSDTASLRCRNNNATKIDIKVEEEQSRDSEMYHTKESIGYIAISR